MDTCFTFVVIMLVVNDEISAVSTIGHFGSIICRTTKPLLLKLLFIGCQRLSTVHDLVWVMICRTTKLLLLKLLFIGCQRLSTVYDVVLRC